MVDIIGRAKVIVESTVDKSSLDTTAGTIGAGIKKAALVGVAGFGLLAVAGIKSAKAFEEAEAVSRKLNTVLGNMGKLGAAEAVSNLASSLQRVTGVDDEVIKGGQTILATFSEVAKSAGEVGGSFERATKLSLDLAAAGFGDVRSASVQLGKALQDPIKGVTALNRSGVTFTATQKEQIKNFVETGDVAAAQNLILKEVEKQVGGTAEANATASARMSDALGELQEAFGELISEASGGKLNSIPDAIYAAADAISAFAQSEDWQTISDNIADMLKGIGEAKQFLFPAGPEPAGTGTVLAPGTEGGSPLQTLNDTVREEAKQTFWQNVAQGVIEGGQAGELGAAIYETMTSQDIGQVLIDAFQDSWPGFDAWFVEITEGFRTGFWEWWGDVETNFSEGWAALQTLWHTKIDEFKENWRTGWTEVTDIWPEIQAAFQEDWDNLVQSIQDIPGRIKEQVGEWQDAGAALIDGFVEGLKSGFADFKAIINNALGLPRTITLGDGPGGIIPDKSFTIKAFAAGGPASGLALVGERGPELVNFPSGSYVHSAANTKQIVEGSRGDIVFNISTTGETAGLVQELDWWARFGALANV